MSASHGSFLRDTRYNYISAVVARGNYNYVKYNNIYNVCVCSAFEFLSDLL